MTIVKIISLCAGAAVLAGCTANPSDKSVDRMWDRKNVSQLVAGVWVDPNGCDHWIVDDGLEGYLSERLTPDGRPVCSGIAAPTQVVGPFKAGGGISDPVRPGNFVPSGRYIAPIQ